MRLLRLMICGQHGDLPGGSGQGQASCGPRALLQRSPAARQGCSLLYWVLAPRPWGRLPLTSFGWPAPEPWAKTRSSPGAGHLPAAGGVQAGLAGPWGWWLRATSPVAPWLHGPTTPSSPRPCGEAQGKGRPFPTCQRGPQVRGRRWGQEAGPRSLRARRHHPQRTGFAMREAHCAVHTTSQVRGGLWLLTTWPASPLWPACS